MTQALTPDDFLAKVTLIVTQTCKDLWRQEPLSEAELAIITDRILLLAVKEKTNGNAGS